MEKDDKQLVIITGPQAVGKMAVGMALEERTELKLFHNHMTIEMIIRMFPYASDEAQYLISHFREEIFRTMAKSKQKGLIFTYVWAFDDPNDYKNVSKYAEIFENESATIYIVELEADLDTRIERNATPLRLSEKPSKRDVEWSKSNMIRTMEQFRLNSLPGEVPYENYLRIDNTNLTPDEVVDIILEKFQL